jgi:ABC-2 type transport system ATP-binding protein
MNRSSAIIETSGLTKDFGRTRAVDGLNLTIDQGETFGLVGPDGAGKTTTLRTLAGLLSITSGEAKVDGFDLGQHPERIKPRIGYMAQRFSLYGELTVEENLSFFADLFNVRGESLAQRVARLLDFAGLEPFRDRLAVHLSGGMKKKLALACTLIHEPEILLLDEPTTGVDPVSRREFWDILTELHMGGSTILVSTPYMDEAERCSRVGLMYRGRMMVCDDPLAIRSRVQGELIELRTPAWRKARELIEDLPSVREVQTFGESLRIFLRSEEDLPDLRERLARAGIEVSSTRSAPARMEEAFVSLIRELEG